MAAMIAQPAIDSGLEKIFEIKKYRTDILNAALLEDIYVSWATMEGAGLETYQPDYVSANTNVTIANYEANLSFPWNYKFLSTNRNFNVAYILGDITLNPGHAWDFRGVSLNESVVIQEILDNHLQQWDFRYLSINMNLQLSCPVFPSTLLEGVELVTETFFSYALITPWDYRLLTRNINTTWNYILARPEYDWDYGYFSSNTGMLWSVMQLGGYPFEYNYMMLNPSMTQADLTGSPDIPWNYEYYSSNINVTMDFVLSLIDKSWDFERLSRNTAITYFDMVSTKHLPWNTDFLEVKTRVTVSYPITITGTVANALTTESSHPLIAIYIVDATSAITDESYLLLSVVQDVISSSWFNYTPNGNIDVIEESFQIYRLTSVMGMSGVFIDQLTTLLQGAYSNIAGPLTFRMQMYDSIGTAVSDFYTFNTIYVSPLPDPELTGTLDDATLYYETPGVLSALAATNYVPEDISGDYSVEITWSQPVAPFAPVFSHISVNSSWAIDGAFNTESTTRFYSIFTITDINAGLTSLINELQFNSVGALLGPVSVTIAINKTGLEITSNTYTNITLDTQPIVIPGPSIVGTISSTEIYYETMGVLSALSATNYLPEDYMGDYFVQISWSIPPAASEPIFSPGSINPSWAIASINTSSITNFVGTMAIADINAGITSLLAGLQFNAVGPLITNLFMTLVVIKSGAVITSDTFTYITLDTNAPRIVGTLTDATLYYEIPSVLSALSTSHFALEYFAVVYSVVITWSESIAPSVPIFLSSSYDSNWTINGAFNTTSVTQFDTTLPIVDINAALTTLLGGLQFNNAGMFHSPVSVTIVISRDGVELTNDTFTNITLDVAPPTILGTLTDDTLFYESVAVISPLSVIGLLPEDFTGDYSVQITWSEAVASIAPVFTNIDASWSIGATNTTSSTLFNSIMAMGDPNVGVTNLLSGLQFSAIGTLLGPVSVTVTIFKNSVELVSGTYTNITLDTSGGGGGSPAITGSLASVSLSGSTEFSSISVSGVPMSTSINQYYVQISSDLMPAPGWQLGPSGTGVSLIGDKMYNNASGQDVNAAFTDAFFDLFIGPPPPGSGTNKTFTFDLYDDSANPVPATLLDSYGAIVTVTA